MLCPPVCLPQLCLRALLAPLRPLQALDAPVPALTDAAAANPPPNMELDAPVPALTDAAAAEPALDVELNAAAAEPALDEESESLPQCRACGDSANWRACG